ncbi:general transcription factor IIH subunit 3-like [Oscarella lobularis]|uniref:general transcription factor IIH subunit 3-like n=1 Tax=Oscarella lobularis TaxID=121494 RepID=UPI003313D1CA
MAGERPSQLVLVVDVSPVHWGRLNAAAEESLSFTRCVENVCVFLNAFMMINDGNKIAVLASHPLENRFVYPTSNVPSDGVRYELFAALDKAVVDGMKAMAQKLTLHENVIADGSPSLMAGSLAKALCYINRTTQAGGQLQSRILIVKVSPDAPAQYMATMNCIFGAQKNGIPIDACIIGPDSGFLQQASDLTGGMYLRVPEPKALLQYLMWVFLPDASIRNTLVFPSRALVDYRAACFCHRKLVEVGFVCSVCLSIFCQFNPVCLTCNSRFRVPGLGAAKGKKKNVT